MLAEILEKEILAAIRGKKTARQCSTELGFVQNQWQYWETGRSRIKWETFISLLQENDRSSIEEVLQLQFDKKIKIIDCQKMVNLVLAPHNLTELAKVISVDRHVLSKVRQGKIKLTLNLLLRILCSFAPQSDVVIQSMFPRYKLMTLEKRIKKYEKLLDHIVKNPFLSAILPLLWSKEYEELPSKVSTEEWLSKKFKIRVEVIFRSLEKLVALGFLQKNKNRYFTKSSDIQVKFGAHKDALKVHSYWYNLVATLLAQKKTDGSIYTINNCSIPNELFPEVLNEIKIFNAKIHTILKKDVKQKGDSAYTILMAVCNLTALQ